jgi:hypothetical protein
MAGEDAGGSRTTRARPEKGEAGCRAGRKPEAAALREPTRTKRDAARGRFEWDGTYGEEHLAVADVDAWPNGRVRASSRGRLALDAPLNTYPVVRRASGAYSLESGPPATRQAAGEYSTRTCCRGAPDATLLMREERRCRVFMAGSCAKPGGSWQRASRFPPGARCHGPRVAACPAVGSQARRRVHNARRALRSAKHVVLATVYGGQHGSPRRSRGG